MTPDGVAPADFFSTGQTSPSGGSSTAEVPIAPSGDGMHPDAFFGSTTAPADTRPTGNIDKMIAADQAQQDRAQRYGDLADLGAYGTNEAALHGATFGASDQLRAGAQAAGAYLVDKFHQLTGNTDQTPSFGQDYSAAIGNQRAMREQFENTAPATSIAANLIGGLAVPVGGVEKAGAEAVGMLARIAKGAGVGALMGGTEGALDVAGTGSASDVAQAAGRGAVIGGVLGGVIPPAAAGVKYAASKLPAGALSFTRAGREQAAAQEVLNRASNPDAVKAAAATPESEQQIVPDSQPTLFGLTGDPGVGQLERSVALQAPDQFAARRLEQSGAQLAAQRAIAPASADPADMGNFVRNQLRQLDEVQDHEAAIARENATSAAGEAGNVAEKAQSDIAQQNAFRQQKLLGTVQEATDTLGGHGTPMQYGEDIKGATDAAGAPRSGILGAQQTVKENVGTIWNTLRQSNPALDVSPLQFATHTLRAETPDAADLAPGEKAIYDQIGQWPQVQSFDEIQAMRARLGQAISDNRLPSGQPAAGRRLSIVKSALDETVANAAQRTAAVEQAGVQAGAIAPEDTLFARLQQEAQQEAQQHVADAQARTTALQSGRAPGTGDSGAALQPAGPGGVRPEAGGQGAPGAGFGVAPRGAGVPGAEPLTPNWTEQHTAQYREAQAATAAQKQAFNQGAVGKITALRAYGEPATPTEQVAGTLFNAGRHSEQDLQQGIDVLQKDPVALDTLRDYAASTLRKAAVNEDGTLNTAAYQRWLAKFGPRMEQLDAALDGHGTPLGDRLSTAAAAQRELDAATMRGAGQQKLIDGIAGDLKTRLMRPDGTLDPKQYARWLQQNADRLEQFPEIRDKFDTAAKAADTLADTQARHAAARADLEKSALGKFIDTPDPVQTVGAMLSRGDANRTIPQLSRQVAGDADATNGLKRATMDWIDRQFVRGPENQALGQQSIRAEAFKRFVSEKGGVLEHIIGADGVGTLRNIADDMTRNARVYTEAKLPGGSDTAQNLAAQAKLGRGSGFFGNLYHGMTEGLGLLAIMEKMGFVGTGAAIVGRALVGSNIKSTQELITHMILNPSFAGQAMRKLPVAGPARDEFARRLASSLQRAATQPLTAGK